MEKKIEYAPAEMKKNGADVIHLATGLVVGYPPCPRLRAFCEFIPDRYGREVIVGTHPIPQNYYLTHQILGTWQSDQCHALITHILTNEKMRLAYDDAFPACQRNLASVLLTRISMDLVFIQQMQSFPGYDSVYWIGRMMVNSVN